MSRRFALVLTLLLTPAVSLNAGMSPVNQGYHYNHNAETYYETGERLGRAMAELLRSTK